METIKNYLETMFATMPNTDEVRRAKAELSQMMEDKYNELLSEGKSENEAVGEVISNFGNLDELAESLGLRKVMDSKKVNEKPRRMVSLEEAKNYIDVMGNYGYRLGLGILLCIVSVIPPIIGDLVGVNEAIMACVMLIMVACGVALMIYARSIFRNSVAFDNELCQIDLNTANHVADMKKEFVSTYSLRMTVGIICCVICWLPAVLADEFLKLSDIGAVGLFILVGFGVFLIVSTNVKNGAYEKILHLNDINTISGSYGKEARKVYRNDFVATLMSIYWPVVTCIYFIWSFASFEWFRSWIIWPVAAVVAKIIDINFVKEED